jgi:sterol desaturase/sphingolipid hydroxylase (fatty acid hydroxylase superfamily)
VREASYGTLFIGLGLFAWHGGLALLIAALLVLEVLVTATDEFVENRTRVLPQNERVLHVFLTLNYGLIVALLVPTLWRWGQEPTALAWNAHGWSSWALAFFGASSLAWSVRDLLAWRRLSAAPGGASSA